jgi:hypothetical protein
LNARYEAVVLPAIDRYTGFACRGVQCPDKREDIKQEVRGIGRCWFKRLAEKGVDGTRFPCVLAHKAAQHVRSHRRLTGSEKAKDAMSSLAQARPGFVIKALPISPRNDYENLHSKPHSQQAQDEFEQRLQHNLITPVDEQVRFKLDITDWLKTLTTRERKLVKAMGHNERTGDLSKIFHLSEGRIGRLRGQFKDGWNAFCDGDASVGRRRAR